MAELNPVIPADDPYAQHVLTIMKDLNAVLVRHKATPDTAVQACINIIGFALAHHAAAENVEPGIAAVAAMIRSAVLFHTPAGGQG